ncbi:hypothetical protein [Streptomyces sp. NBC_00859]|uniref:hypothetical protein n=1 Tax=Streptomyces sp. NBC_00859 TaxID=2903682 RepID=UPI0038660716|nr:hypothetical protein OG584_00085 [Streptomyces sp. NBC_00859]
MARSLQVPVLAAFDTDDPAAVAALDPDVTLTLTRRGERAQVVVSERDFGPLATVELRAELPYTRFADLGTAPAPAPSASRPAAVQPTGRPGAPPAENDAVVAEQVLASGEVSDAEMGVEPEVAEKGTVFPALAILRACADEHSKMHPVRVIRKDLREGAPWTLFSEVMDGEPRWVHPEVERVRTRGGKRDELIVPDSFGAGQLLTIDRNGSYPSACSAVPLAPNILHHTGPLEARANDQAGAFQITVPAWNHAEMPHPLGRIADRMDEDGRAWVTTPHLKHLEKLIRQGLITEPLTIHDSWTGRLNESLFKPFYQAAKDARTELLAAGGGEPYVEYKRRLSIGLRLIWPKGEKVISPFWRPDWRMSLVAEASVRHWATAWRAVQAGATLVALRNVDEAVFFTSDVTAPAPYKVGTGFGEVKIKTEGDDV